MAIEKNDQGLYEGEVDGKIYEFQKWGAERSAATLFAIAGIVADPLGQVAGDMLSKRDGVNFQDVLDLNLDGDMVSKAVKALFANMNERMAMGLLKKFCAEGVLCEGKKIDFNLHYQDRLDHMFKVLRLAVEVQYGNFFSAVTDLLRAWAPKKDPKVRLTSTG